MKHRKREKAAKHSYRAEREKDKIRKGETEKKKKRNGVTAKERGCDGEERERDWEGEK